GGTANTKGAYVQMTASTGAVTQILSTNLDWVTAGVTGSDFWMDISTGAAASEVVLVPDMYMGTSNQANQPVYKSATILTYIAASSRIAMRGACSSNAAATRVISASLYAATAPSEPSASGGYGAIVVR